MTTKKNWTMRAAVLMLALVLITSCFVGGTFAKYVTSGKGEDTARVAKFGVTVKASGTTFAKEYKTDDKTATTITKSVISSDDKVNVVAPGTSGSMTNVTIEGTPEVAVRVSHEATVFTVENWIYKNEDEENPAEVFYCPLVITVGKTQIKGLDYNNAEAFQDAVKKAISGYSKDYDPKTDLSQIDEKLDIGWAWAFEVNNDNDVKDTYLGDQAAEGNAATISLTVTTTVTQID